LADLGVELGRLALALLLAISRTARPSRELLDMAKIGMTSHVLTWESGDEGDKAVKGAIAYIEKHGEQDAKRLLEVLEAVQPATITLRALAREGTGIQVRWLSEITEGGCFANMAI
jgi:hypothetical protein